METGISRIKLIAIGNSKYQFLDKLNGPENDIANLRSLLVESKKTALLEPKQCTWIANATGAKLRQTLTDWAYAISCPGDILIFYFSGHGAVLPNLEFGLCMVDTQYHPSFDTTIISSLVPVNELFLAISAVKATPMIILDACYSGSAITQMKKTLDSMAANLQKEHASAYGIFSSCRTNETSFDLTNSGLFSNILQNISSTGKKKVKSSYLSLLDIFEDIRLELEQSAFDMNPLLLLGDTFPVFPWVKNVAFKPLKETMIPSYVNILRYLWNNGNPQMRTTQEMSQTLRTGGYGNNRKLMLEPWKLLTTYTGQRTRMLTSRGVAFMKGEIAIPKTIVKDDLSETWKALEGTPDILISDFPDNGHLFYS
jgi:hypothetical protein